MTNPAKPPEGGAPLTQQPPATSPEGAARLRDLLFGNQPLEVLVKDVDPRALGDKTGPASAFAAAAAAAKQGQVAAAKQELRRVLAMPDPDTSVLLSTWTALRALGERPPAELAHEVQGVVVELHDQAGVGTLAAYADGRARWLGGQGAVTVWEKTDDVEVSGLITDLLKAAEPVMAGVRAVPKHASKPVAKNHVRATVLTFGGLHPRDTDRSKIDGKHVAGPLLVASTKLIEALSRRGGERK